MAPGTALAASDFVVSGSGPASLQAEAGATNESDHLLIVNVMAPDADVQAYAQAPMAFSLASLRFPIDGVRDSHSLGYDRIPLDNSIFDDGAGASTHLATFVGVNSLIVSDFAVI